MVLWLVDPSRCDRVPTCSAVRRRRGNTGGVISDLTLSGFNSFSRLFLFPFLLFLSSGFRRRFSFIYLFFSYSFWYSISNVFFICSELFVNATFSGVADTCTDYARRA